MNKFTGFDFLKKLPGKPVWYYIGIYAIVAIALFHEPLFSPSKLLFGTDLLSGNIFFRQFLTEYFKTHLNWPVWDPFIHGGMPFVDGMHGDIFYIPTLIFYLLFGLFYAWGFTIALHVFAAGIFMYLFLKELNIRDKVAFLFGLIYMMAPFFITLAYAGHNGKMFVITLTPLIFYLFHRAIYRRKLIYYVLLSLTMFLVMTTPHMQFAYFLFVTLGIYFIVTIIQRWRQEKTFPLRPAILLTLAVILGLMLSLVQFLTPYQYLRQFSSRTLFVEFRKDYYFSTWWSLQYEDVAGLFFPEFCGYDLEGERSTYWGRNSFKANSEHFSLIAIFLSILAIGLWRNNGKWFFFWTAIITLLFALGENTPFFRLFYLIPGISSFRCPSSIIFITGFAVITLGAMGLEGLFQAEKSDLKMKKVWKIYTYITIGYSVIVLMIIILQMEFFRKIWLPLTNHPVLINPTHTRMVALYQSINKITSGAIISLFIVIMLYVLIKLYLSKKIKSAFIILVLASFTFIYLWHFNSRYITTIDPDPYYAKTPLIDFLKSKQEDELFRVMVMPQTARDYFLAYHSLEELSFTMRHGNQLACFNKLFCNLERIRISEREEMLEKLDFLKDHGLAPKPDVKWLRSPAFQYGIFSMFNSNMVYQSIQDLLNVKYIISFWDLTSSRFKKIDKIDEYGIYENLTALPRAFPVYKYEVIGDDSKLLSVLMDTTFDYRSCIIFEELPDKLPPIHNDTLKLPVIAARVYDRKNDSFKVDVEMLADGFLFLGENYYPAWKAYENNKQLPTYKADMTFRAVPLKKGFHTVVCKYENKMYSIASTISLSTFIFIAFALAGLCIKEGFKK